MAPQVGLEPTTDRLTADCSTTELLRNNSISFYRTTKIIPQLQKIAIGFFIVFSSSIDDFYIIACGAHNGQAFIIKYSKHVGKELFVLKKLGWIIIICTLILVLWPSSIKTPQILSVFKLTEEPDVVVRGTSGSALTLDISFGDSALENWIAELEAPYPLLVVDTAWAMRFPDSAELIRKKNIPVALLGKEGAAYEEDSALFTTQLEEFSILFEKKPLWFRTSDEVFPKLLQESLWKHEINALGSTLRWKGGKLPPHKKGEILTVALERKGKTTLDDIDRLLASREFQSVEDVLFATDVKTKKIPE